MRSFTLFLLIALGCCSLGYSACGTKSAEMASSTVLTYAASGKLLLHQPGQKEIILIAHQGDAPEIGDAYIRQANRSSVVLSPSNGGGYTTFKPGGKIIGISILRRSNEVARLLKGSGANLQIAPEAAQEILNSMCSCLPDDAAADDCSSGGKGATSCFTGVGNYDEMAADERFQKGCAVSCQEGFFACCP